jgi:hypothetical protein
LGNTQADTSRVKVRALMCSLMLAAASVGVMDAMRQQSVAPSQLAEPPLGLTPSEALLYEFAPTLIGWTPQQVRDCPVLHKLRPAADQDQLPMVLERAGQTDALVFADFPQISCDEAIISETSGGKTLRTKPQKFRYMVIPRPIGDVRGLEEYRTDLQGKPCDLWSLADTFMITYGFASSWLYLSAAERHDNHFRYFGIQKIRNQECHVVGFAQDSDRARRAEAFDVEGRRVTLLVQGLAWVDSQTFQILRIMTWLLAPRTDIGLSSQISTVDFYPVQPSGAERVLWLPHDVEVWIQYRGIAVRNTHRYSNFKLFRVESTIKP